MKIQLPSIDKQKSIVYEIATKDAISQLQANLLAPKLPLRQRSSNGRSLLTIYFVKMKVGLHHILTSSVHTSDISSTISLNITLIKNWHSCLAFLVIGVYGVQIR